VFSADLVKLLSTTKSEFIYIFAYVS
jgi:hypothetical protein